MLHLNLRTQQWGLFTSDGHLWGEINHHSLQKNHAGYDHGTHLANYHKSTWFIHL